MPELDLWKTEKDNFLEVILYVGFGPLCSFHFIQDLLVKKDIDVFNLKGVQNVPQKYGIFKIWNNLLFLPEH